jgi:hypothetical protein
VLEEHS